MRRYLVLAALVAVTGSCSSEGGTGPSGPTPGIGEVRLTSVPAGTGAVQFTIQGGAMSNFAAASGYTPYTRVASSTSTQVVLVAAGDAANGIVFTFAVPDVSLASSYTVSSGGGAANASYAVVAPSSVGFSVQVRRDIGF